MKTTMVIDFDFGTFQKEWLAYFMKAHSEERGMKNLKYQFSKVSEQSVTENPDFGFIRSINTEGPQIV